MATVTICSSFIDFVPEHIAALYPHCHCYSFPLGLNLFLFSLLLSLPQLKWYIYWYSFLNRAYEPLDDLVQYLTYASTSWLKALGLLNCLQSSLLYASTLPYTNINIWCFILWCFFFLTLFPLPGQHGPHPFWNLSPLIWGSYSSLRTHFLHSLPPGSFPDLLLLALLMCFRGSRAMLCFSFVVLTILETLWKLEPFIFSPVLSQCSTESGK